MLQNKKTRIAVIGDGLASATCINAFAQSSNMDRYQIDVYARSKVIGRGLAYSKDTPGVMSLNHPVKNMRFADETGQDFLSYLKDHYRSDMPDLNRFVSRRIFGDYVEDRMKTIFNTHADALNIITAPVKQIIPWGDQTSIMSSYGVEKYDATILCIGGGDSNDDLACDKTYELSNVSGQNVAIIGGSLTAVDMLNVMMDDIDTMPRSVTILQRSDGFRMVRPSETYNIKPKYFTQRRVNWTNQFTADDLISLINREIQEQGVDYNFMNYGYSSCKGSFNAHIQECLDRQSYEALVPQEERMNGSNGFGFFEFTVRPQCEGRSPEFQMHDIMLAIIMPLMSVFEQEKISPSEAKKFRDRCEKQLFSYLAPMPAHVADDLQCYIGDKMGHVIKLESGFDANRDQDRLKDFDAVFDARGINKTITSTDHLPNVVKPLIGGHFGYLSQLGGVSYNPQNSQMRSHADVEMPYVVGQLKKGQQFDCSESQVIYMDSMKIVSDIKKRFNI
jgi:hypothetical protein